jgi:predicted peroxiredoxin
MMLSGSHAVRALALWCLVLTGICAPVLIYITDDGAAAVMKDKAAAIQQKQHDRLSHAQ